MSSLAWSEALSLSMPVMDQTHMEFVDLLADVERAPDGSLASRWQALIDHTQVHFDQEDAWMQATGFAPQNCHSTQHKVVLQVLREGADAGAQGQLHVIRQMARELALWFPQHAQTMDASLALHLKSVGHDPHRGELNRPEKLPAQAISGCGGSCHDSDDRHGHVSPAAA